MAANRRAPTVANYGATIPDTTYSTDIDEEAVALWGMVTETLGSVAGTNSITAACTPTLLTYTPKQYWFTPAVTNSGPVTLNIDSLGQKDVLTQAGVALVSGELASGVPTPLYFNGTNFRIGYPALSTAAATLPMNYLSGFTVSNNTGTPNSYVDIALGVARDTGNTVNINGTAMTKQLNAVWAAGTNAGAILQSANLTGTITITTNTAVTGTGTAFSTDFQVGDVITSAGGQARRITVVASNISMTVESVWSSGETTVTYKRGGRAKSTRYRLFAIYKSTDTTVDYALSARDTPVDLPTNYTVSRRIAYVPTNTSGNNYQFSQIGDWFTLTTLVVDTSATLSTGVTNTITSLGPPNVLLNLTMDLSAISDNASTFTIGVRETIVTAGQERNIIIGLQTIDSGGDTNSLGSRNAIFNVFSDSLNQYITKFASSGGSSITQNTNLLGWVDTRGRG